MDCEKIFCYAWLQIDLGSPNRHHQWCASDGKPLGASADFWFWEKRTGQLDFWPPMTPMTDSQAFREEDLEIATLSPKCQLFWSFLLHCL